MGGLMPAQPGKIAVNLLAQLHPGQVLHPDDLGGLSLTAAYRLDNDLLELLDVREPAQGVDGELKVLVRRAPAAPRACPATTWTFCCWMALTTSMVVSW